MFLLLLLSIYLTWDFLALTVNIQTNGMVRYADTIFILQLTCVISPIRTQHSLYFQTNAIHIAAIHSEFIYNNGFAISFPKMHFTER